MLHIAYSHQPNAEQSTLLQAPRIPSPQAVVNNYFDTDVLSTMIGIPVGARLWVYLCQATDLYRRTG